MCSSDLLAGFALLIAPIRDWKLSFNCSSVKDAFPTPVSCHLYPIRVEKYDTFEAVNYNRWSICKAAEILGKKEKLPVYKFLKEPLVRRFGKDWYEALEEIAGEWEKQKNEE